MPFLIGNSQLNVDLSVRVVRAYRIRCPRNLILGHIRYIQLSSWLRAVLLLIRLERPHRDMLIVFLSDHLSSTGEPQVTDNIVIRSGAGAMARCS